MPKIRFTDSKVRSLATRKRQEDFTDTRYPDLLLRVYPSGRKTWLHRVRIAGKRRGDKLGVYPDLSVANAVQVWRIRAGDLAAGEETAEGVDEQIRVLEEQIAELRRRSGRVLTFGDLAAEYVERYAKPRKKTWRQDVYLLDRYPLPAWSHEPADAITKRAIVELLEDVASNAPIQANRLLRLLSRVWGWGQGADLVPTNPTLGIEAPSVEQRRDRVLSDTEISAVWDGAAVSLVAVMRDAFRFALATGQRREEITGMRWAEVEGDWWTLAAARTKAGRPHRVYLGVLAQGILRRQDSKGPCIFESPRIAGKPIHADSLTHSVIRLSRELVERGEIAEPFRLHDLRRTAATGMARHGVERHVLSRVLNHADSSVTAIYDLYRYDDQVMAAHQAWSRHLAEVVHRRPEAGS